MRTPLTPFQHYRNSPQKPIYMGHNTERKHKRPGRVGSDEMRRRLAAVQQWINDGRTTAEMVDAARQQWGISQGHAYQYIRQATVAAGGGRPRGRGKVRRAYHIALRQKLLATVVDDNPAMALKILQDMAQMEGLYATKPTTARKDADGGEKPAEGTASATAITLSNGTVISLDK